jgi:DNA-binding beta-propeller fold protein YncE
MMVGVAACAGTAGLATAGTAIAGGPVHRAGTRPGLWHATRFDPQQRSNLAALLPNAARPVAGRPAKSVALSGVASLPIANPKTKTVYVPIQNSDVVDVINAAACNSRRTSGCRVVAKAKVGMFGPNGGPLAAVADIRTDTVYVVNARPRGAGTVTVFNGARCNSMVTAGCDHVIATINVGRFPVAAVLSPRTGTLYVANVASQSISVIDAAGCNAVTTRACGRTPRTINDPAGPGWLDVSNATDTLYAANSGTSGHGDTVSVFNGATCNARRATGCGQVPRTVTVGSGAFALAVNQASGAVYVTSNDDGTTSVINGATCNAKITSGCGHAPVVVTTGPSTQFVAIDAAVHTAFTISLGDGTLSEINTRTCDGSARSGCPSVARNERATPNASAGGKANAFALMPATGTAYLANVGGARILSLVSISRCNATNTSGCRVLPPSVPKHEFMISVDRVTGTLYAANVKKPRIDVISAATCNATDLSGCKPVAEIPMPDPQANMSDVIQSTHTLYASDPFSDTVSVINTAACNAEHTAGCALKPPTITVGPGPGPPAFDKTTKTIYVPVGGKADKVAVVSTATCNAINSAGCTTSPAFVTVGNGTFILAVSQATNTVYAPATGYLGAGRSHMVAVINGATCNGTDHSGCGHLAAVVRAGLNPLGVGVDDATHTVYVSNNGGSGDVPGSLSLINGATCNGTHTSGCAVHPPTVTIGRSPQWLSVDVSTDTVYVADEFSADVSIVNGARCNATATTCHNAVREQPAGSTPVNLAIDGGTLYVNLIFPFPNGPMAVIKIQN